MESNIWFACYVWLVQVVWCRYYSANVFSSWPRRERNLLYEWCQSTLFTIYLEASQFLLSFRKVLFAGKKHWTVRFHFYCLFKMQTPIILEELLREHVYSKAVHTNARSQISMSDEGFIAFFAKSIAQVLNIYTKEIYCFPETEETSQTLSKGSPSKKRVPNLYEWLLSPNHQQKADHSGPI